jgi:hypothetical protein
MKRWIAVLLLTMVGALTASAARKEAGTTILKDVQPAGTTNAKEKKNQQYDFIFEASANHYTCSDQSENLFESERLCCGQRCEV